VRMNKQERKTSYSTFFNFGIAFIVLGLGLLSAVGSPGFAFLGVGLTFMMFGLANRDKWVESKKKT
jgi:hypothetical protein